MINTKKGKSMKVNKKVRKVFFGIFASSLLVGTTTTALLQNNKIEINNHQLVSSTVNKADDTKSHLVKLAQGSKAYHSAAI